MTPLDLQDTRIFLTGARGFIGRHVLGQARTAGAEVVAFPGDVRDRKALLDAVLDAAPTHVINLAAPVDVRRDPALQPIMDGVIHDGAVHLYDAAAALPSPPAFLQCGTCEEYGTIAAPFAEDDEPSAPVSPYAAAKLQATRTLLAGFAARPDGPRVVVARPFLTYGPGQLRRQLIPAAIDAALARERFPMTEGLQTREVNHVGDIARGLLLAASTPAAAGRIVNLGCGEEIRVVDLVRLIFELAGAPAELLEPGAIPTRPGEVPRFFADTRRARRLLGYRPQVGLREGLLETIADRRGT